LVDSSSARCFGARATMAFLHFQAPRHQGTNDQSCNACRSCLELRIGQPANSSQPGPHHSPDAITSGTSSRPWHHHDPELCPSLTHPPDRRLLGLLLLLGELESATLHPPLLATPSRITMDTLVAQYSRPAYQQNEPFSEDDGLDFSDSVPGLSLKFAMPPVAHVSSPRCRLLRQPARRRAASPSSRGLGS